MGAPTHQKMVLAMKSGNMCAFPDCGKALSADATDKDPSAVLGEAAHIFGERDGAARHEPTKLDPFVNSSENLIFLCREHHRLIDRQPNSYPVEMLFGWKEKHEGRIKESVDDAMPGVSFAELEVVTKAMVRSAKQLPNDLTIVSPSEKIRKNNLSARSEFLITSGLGTSRLVMDFIQETDAVVPGFANDLITGFKAQYDQLVQDGLIGDELFDGMHLFSCNGNSDAAIQAAGLAVLVHLFETCDVFER